MPGMTAILSRRRFLLAAAATAAASPAALAAGQAKKRQPYYGAEMVRFNSPERLGTIIVNTGEKALYHIIAPGVAMRYGVAVGKAGFDWAGIAKVGRKVEWPVWTPPRSMIVRKPELAQWAKGMPGGPKNPLGARAIYLFAGGRDTLFRIHGTNEPWSIGSAASSGCIRMLNQEVIELYDQITLGDKVIVI